MNQPSLVIVKSRKRPSEPYEREKLLQSVRASLQALRSPAGVVSDTSTEVCNRVEAWLTNKSMVTSADLRRKASEALEHLHPEAAYLYKNHHQIL